MNPYLRHPLVEQLSDLFVPNDSYLVGGCGIGTESVAAGYVNSDVDESDNTSPPPQCSGPYSVLVCTGANACGKVFYARDSAGTWLNCS